MEYDLSHQKRIKDCRFNSGVVLQTIGDEISYKYYVATRPKKDLFYRFRLDKFGEKNIEKHKGTKAPQEGKIRIIRRSGQITFWNINDGGGWEKIFTFKQLCHEKLRLRFKLQTSEPEAEKGNTCPVIVRFDNFVVNTCDQVIAD